MEKVEERHRFSDIIAGNDSPLFHLEPIILSTIIYMSHVFQSLISTNGLQLVNGMIYGTATHTNLISFKEKYPVAGDTPGKVGPGY